MRARQSRGNEDATDPLELGFGAKFFDFFRIHFLNFHPAIVGDATVNDRLHRPTCRRRSVQRISPPRRSGRGAGGNQFAQNVLPMRHIGRRHVQPQEPADQIVRAVLLEHEGHFVNRVLDIPFLDDGFVRDVAEERDFLAQSLFKAVRSGRPRCAV